MTGVRGRATVRYILSVINGFRITERQFYRREFKCNWKLILARCVSLVMNREKNGLDAGGMSSCVWVIEWFGKEDVKKYRTHLAANYYVCSVCTILL